MKKFLIKQQTSCPIKSGQPRSRECAMLLQESCPCYEECLNEGGKTPKTEIPVLNENNERMDDT